MQLQLLLSYLRGKKAQQLEIQVSGTEAINPGIYPFLLLLFAPCHVTFFLHFFLY